jgi:hypothetical protein
MAGPPQGLVSWRVPCWRGRLGFAWRVRMVVSPVSRMSRLRPSSAAPSQAGQDGVLDEFLELVQDVAV